MTTAVLVLTAVGGAAPAMAATPAGPDVDAAVIQEVGPYSAFDPCDYDRRLYSTRYGHKTYPCQEFMNGWWFKYVVK